MKLLANEIFVMVKKPKNKKMHLKMFSKFLKVFMVDERKTYFYASRKMKRNLISYLTAFCKKRKKLTYYFLLFTRKR